MPLQGYLGSGYFNLPMVQAATGSTFFAAMQTYLLAQAPLSSLTGVYLRRPPVNPLPSPPYLIVSGVGGTCDINSQDFYLDNAQLQFTVVASDDVTAETLGEAAFESLRPKSTNPKFSGPTFGESYRNIGTKGILMPQSTRWTDNENIWTYVFGIVFSISRP